jgi:hypothetical protein
MDRVPTLLRNATRELESGTWIMTTKLQNIFQKQRRETLIFQMSTPKHSYRGSTAYLKAVNPEDKECFQCDKKRIIAREPRAMPVVHCCIGRPSDKKFCQESGYRCGLSWRDSD